ncbi:fluoride efflux transporter FluC [Nocardiopsis kunsanensis]|uniref:Fluoride-specific ion channel FluC n=1 Tax=Nocardiopsis kunsanensis TaxID=141693 RepID=A0A918XAE0_9ACTN|nr:CrcB family protein [Nocardiopsis kunsanensis]GHD21716.1 putative fluoride ion transporter CrcB 2 [Nocardiopsis kunsanensis]
MSALAVAVGAALGAPVRFLVDLALRGVLGAAFPWGTLAVNATGSLLLGALLGLPLSPQAMAVWGTGFCGALTTYSTFALETVQLARGGTGRRAAVYVLVSLALGTGSAWVGLAVTSAVVS